MNTERKQQTMELANEAALQRELEKVTTDEDTRTIARIMAETAEEQLLAVTTPTFM